METYIAARKHTDKDPVKDKLKRFGLFGPPGTIFFDAQGKEVAAARTIGSSA